MDKVDNVIEVVVSDAIVLVRLAVVLEIVLEVDVKVSGVVLMVLSNTHTTSHSAVADVVRTVVCVDMGLAVDDTAVKLLFETHVIENT